MNPIGFECENQVLNIKEVEFVEQVRCYKTTEEVCSMVKLFWTLLTIFSYKGSQSSSMKELWRDPKIITKPSVKSLR